MFRTRLPSGWVRYWRDWNDWILYTFWRSNLFS